MSSISLRRGAKSEIDATPISDGQILFETDQESNRIYMDNGDERIQVGGSETTWDNIQNKPDNITFWDSALSTTIPNVDYIGIKEISQVAYDNLTPTQKQLEIVYDITDATDNDYYTNAVDVAYNDTDTQLGASNVQDAISLLNSTLVKRLSDKFGIIETDVTTTAFIAQYPQGFTSANFIIVGEMYQTVYNSWVNSTYDPNNYSCELLVASAGLSIRAKSANCKKAKIVLMRTDI